MKTRVVAIALALFATLGPAVAWGQDKKPDFSGKWTLDESRSDAPAGRAGRAGLGRGAGRGAAALGGGANGPVLIAQTATEITIGAVTYKLDGSATTLGQRGGAEAKAHWEGTALVVETTIDLQGTAVATKQVRRLSDDGKEMTVESTVNAPRGALTTRQVFTKAS